MATTEELETTADALAGRLRVLRSQAEAVGAAPAGLKQLLRKEVEGGVSAFSKTDRKRCLQALASRFPTVRQSAPSPAPAPPKPLTAEEHVQKLIELLPGVSASECTAFSRRLEKAGFIPSRGALSDEISRSLGVTDGQRIAPERLKDLALLLTTSMKQIQEITSQALGQLLPQQEIPQRQIDLSNAIAGYLVVDGRTPARDLDEYLRGVERVCAAFSVAIHEIQGAIEQEYKEDYSPSAVKQAAEAKVIPLWANRHATYWERYLEMTEPLSTPGEVRHRVKKCLAKILKKFFQQPPPPPRGL